MDFNEVVVTQMDGRCRSCLEVAKDMARSEGLGIVRPDTLARAIQQIAPSDAKRAVNGRALPANLVRSPASPRASGRRPATVRFSSQVRRAVCDTLPRLLSLQRVETAAPYHLMLALTETVRNKDRMSFAEFLERKKTAWVYRRVFALEEYGPRYGGDEPSRNDGRRFLQQAFEIERGLYDRATELKEFALRRIATRHDLNVNETIILEALLVDSLWGLAESRYESLSLRFFAQMRDSGYPANVGSVIADVERLAKKGLVEVYPDDLQVRPESFLKLGDQVLRQLVAALESDRPEGELESESLLRGFTTGEEIVYGRAFEKGP